MVACACSSPDAENVPRHASGWLTVTFSEPSGERECVPAAPTSYNFGSEAKPLVEQVSCSIHWTDDDAWLSGSLADSRTSKGGENVGFFIDTEVDLIVRLVTEYTGTLDLDPAGSVGCASLATVLIDNAASVDFDCALLIHPSEPTVGCGVRGTVTFENCENIE